LCFIQDGDFSSSYESTAPQAQEGEEIVTKQVAHLAGNHNRQARRTFKPETGRRTIRPMSISPFWSASLAKSRSTNGSAGSGFRAAFWSLKREI
jgi:hypothetical protein